MKVVYTGGGSSQGPQGLLAEQSPTSAISEIPYQGVDEHGNADTSNGREFAYLPIVAGGTAFTYQLKVGDELVRNLRLSGETIAKIFTNQITNWNDPAITADNNGRAFPSLADHPGGALRRLRHDRPVHDLDGQRSTPTSGGRSSARPGCTSYYPRKGRTHRPRPGSDQVMNTISGFAGNGTIGYVEYSYPLNKDYPVVKVLNKAGYYVEPTQYNVAVALTKAQINQDKTSPIYLTQILDDVYTHTDPRAYPLSSYSYMIIPTGARRPADDDRQAPDARPTSCTTRSARARPRPARTATRRCRSTWCRPASADRQAQGGRPGRRPRPNRDVDPVQQPDVRRRATSSRTSSPRSRRSPPPATRQGEGPCGTDDRHRRAVDRRRPADDTADGRRRRGATARQRRRQGRGGGGTAATPAAVAATRRSAEVDPITGEAVSRRPAPP